MQINTTATAFDFSEVYGRVWFSNPLRLLLPILPGLNPTTLPELFPAAIEAPWDGVTGWFVLAIAATGFWQSRRHWRIYLPFAIMLALILTYHPQEFPTLKLFPWSKFNRVGGRVTLLLPIFASLFALGIQAQRWVKPKLFAAILLLIGGMELTTAYGLKLGDRPSPIPAQTQNYFAVVREASGEAILDWPVCAIGGNGIGGINGLCPYASTDPAIPWLSRFHRKKVMGQYFGRLHPSQIEPYLQLGLHRLMQPNHPDIYRATQEQRCFKPGEWDFFEKLYRSQDFAGLQLHRDRLPEPCYQKFIERFGKPTAIATLPKMGTLAFIPNNSSIKPTQESLAFNPAFDDAELGHPAGVDLMDVAVPRGLDTTGLSRVRERQAGRWRWAVGDTLTLTLKLDNPQPMRLIFAGTAEAPNQEITLKIQASTGVSSPSAAASIKALIEAPMGQANAQEIPFNQSKSSTIEIQFAATATGQSSSPAAGDRPLAFRFTTLQLKPG
ncbi:MAG: hypothetical protein ACFCBU_18880 [Cyanophyceae cyanobacterium]